MKQTELAQKLMTAEEEEKLAKMVLIAKDKELIEEDKSVTIDMSKNFEENKALIIQMIKAEQLSKAKPIVKPNSSSKEQKAKEEAEAKKKAEAELKALKEEERKIINEWKQQFQPDMIISSPAYFEMEKYIEMICAGFSNFCIIEGAGGLAKTFTANAILRKKLGGEYAYYNSFTSPVAFFNFLYDNSEDKVILIDDTEGIWDNKSIVSILKNATEINGDRIISWNSTTSRLEGRNHTCSFKSRIVLLTNQLPNPEKNPHIEALKTRANYTLLDFSYNEKMDIIKEVSKKDYKELTGEDRKMMYDFIERSTNETTQELSIRTLFKIYHFFLFDKKIWKELAMSILQADKHKEIAYELIQSGKPVKQQESEYQQKTGRSRADYYRVKTEISPKKRTYCKAE